MMAGPDYIVDIQSLKQRGAAHEATRGSSSLTGRPWLAVHWQCCQVYTRVYRNAAGTAYEGRCPRCGKQVSAKVGPGGTHARFFEAS